jgi:hypothetical protein
MDRCAARSITTTEAALEVSCTRVSRVEMELVQGIHEITDRARFQ